MTFLCLFCLAARDNKGPVAVAKPGHQEINQPNDLIIDGSGNQNKDLWLIVLLLFAFCPVAKRLSSTSLFIYLEKL